MSSGRIWRFVGGVAVGFWIGATDLPASPIGEATSESMTSSGPASRGLIYETASRAPVSTPLYAVVQFASGAFPLGAADDGSVLLIGNSGAQRWKGGRVELLQIPQAGEFQVTGMNRGGAILGYSSQPANEGFSCLSTKKGWYWAPGAAMAAEVNNPFSYFAYDECAGRRSAVKYFNPLLLDGANRIWAKAAYAADIENSSAFVGLHRWDNPTASPTQVSYDGPRPGSPDILLLAGVNRADVMIGQRQLSGAAFPEYFAGNQALDFVPLAINDIGDVLGYDGGSASAVFRRNGANTLLPLVYADRLNARGDVAGSYFNLPVLIPAEKMGKIIGEEAMDIGGCFLQDLMPAGWTPLQITGLSDEGVITGLGLYSDQARPDEPAALLGFMLIPAALRVDANRDGVIDGGLGSANPDLELMQKKLPWFFWVNDDNDSGEISDSGGDDTPGAGRNGTDGVVNGMSDLVDFFPVQLDIAALLRLFPPSDISLAFQLAQADGAANFLTTDLTAITSGSYNSDVTVARALSNSPVVRIGPGGVALERSFLGKILAERKGVILVEARGITKQPLRLEIRRAGELLAVVSLPLSFGGVEEMFRHVNLTGAVGITPATHSRAGTPNWADELNNDKAMVFVHGYNVNQLQARGWQAEFFKRMWWSGSRAGFWGVTWYGSQSQVPVAEFTPNYHLNVVNAFGTAPLLAEFIRNLRSPQTGIHEVDVAGHSLGNMVVSSAISDHNAPVDRYFMVDAAVAAEAYDGSETSQVVQPADSSAFMPHTEWNREFGGVYPAVLWAANWYKLFQSLPGDARAKLTWRNRFALREGTAYYDFHSTGEEVLGYDESHSADTPSLAGVLASELKTFLHLALPGSKGQPNGYQTWIYQEQLKGRTITGTVLGSNYGGWGFNTFYFKKQPGGYGKGPVMVSAVLRPDEIDLSAPRFSQEALRSQPFFRKGGNWTKVGTWRRDANGKPEMFNERLALLYKPETGSAFASAHRDTLLARMIPSMSPAVGRIPVARFALESSDEEHNYDLNSTVVRGLTQPWPLQPTRKDKNWRHSDMRAVAFPYVRGLYGLLAELGGLDQQTP